LRVLRCWQRHARGFLPLERYAVSLDRSLQAWHMPGDWEPSAVALDDHQSDYSHSRRSGTPQFAKLLGCKRANVQKS
jgi:hypothetical protein